MLVCWRCCWLSVFKRCAARSLARGKNRLMAILAAIIWRSLRGVERRSCWSPAHYHCICWGYQAICAAHGYGAWWQRPEPYWIVACDANSFFVELACLVQATLIVLQTQCHTSKCFLLKVCCICVNYPAIAVLWWLGRRHAELFPQSLAEEDNEVRKRK